jgi:hypothetical protein
MRKPNYFNTSPSRSLVSCSEDGLVRFWELCRSAAGKFHHKVRSETKFCGPVYRAEYNSLGSMIAISYYEEREAKLETKVFSDRESALGEEIHMLK